MNPEASSLSPHGRYGASRGPRAGCLAAPAAMIAGFVFFNIPQLESRLRGRHGARFDAYAARTKSFIPFVY